MSVALSAVVPAAGASRRMGFNKLLTPVNGVTFLQLTLQRLLKSPQIAELIVVVAPETEAQVRSILEKLGDPRPLKIVLGGAERQDSVLAGLLATDPSTEFVLIHDAARPFVSPELVELVAQAAEEHGAALCGYPSTDTLKESGDGELIVGTPNREKVWAVQTPQIFRRKIIVEAYQQLILSGKQVTDDAAAVSELGQSVKLVRFDGINLKITRPSDWSIACQMLIAVEDDMRSCLHIRKLIHDISNQMTSIMGFSFLLDMDIPEDSPLKDHVNSLNESSQKCHTIVGAMQNVAREMHSKKQEMQQQMLGKSTQE